MFMKKYKSGHWDGYISLMTSLNAFPTGLLGYVVAELKLAGYKVDVDLSIYNGHVFPPVAPDCLNGITLRDYQIKAANALLKAKRGIAKMATNSGKTEVMAAMLTVFPNDGAIVLVHRKDLLYQTAERLSKRLGIKIGVIGDGMFDPRRVTVVMVQTLGNILDRDDESNGFLFNNTVVMVDECHNASAGKYLDVLNRIPGPYRFGFSGTPLKQSVLADMKLVAYTGRVIYEVTNKQMIGAGYSAKPIVHIHTIESSHNNHWEMRYQDAYDQLIVNNETRNECISNVLDKTDGVILVLVSRIEHGNILHSMLKNSIFVHGSSSTEQRREALEFMRQGIWGVFIATNIFDEGIDVPAVDTVVLAGGGKSEIRSLQRIGRGLRQKSGSNLLVVHDFLDDTNKHLFKHSEERILTYEKEGFDVIISKTSLGISL
jgi:superfamily II DNA or RNA helicase